MYRCRPSFIKVLIEYVSVVRIHVVLALAFKSPIDSDPIILLLFWPAIIIMTTTCQTNSIIIGLHFSPPGLGDTVPHQPFLYSELVYAIELCSTLVSADLRAVHQPLKLQLRSYV
jgi:hypothetical protein